MFTLSANLGFLFQELPFLDRIAAAARAGVVDGIEFPHQHGVPARAIADAAEAAGLPIAQFNAPSGNEEPGVNGLCVGKDREAQFVKAIDQAIESALTFGDRFHGLIHVIAGFVDSDEKYEILEDRMVERVRYAGEMFGRHGLTVLLEPLNKHDMPGFFLNDMEQGVRIAERTGRDNVKLQYDVYHAQRTRGDLVRFLCDHFDMIGHVQVADNPGRHQPGTGEINYPFVFEELRRLDYSGWVGIEYVPEPSTEASFGWLRDMGLVV